MYSVIIYAAGLLCFLPTAIKVSNQTSAQKACTYYYESAHGAHSYAIQTKLATCASDVKRGGAEGGCTELSDQYLCRQRGWRTIITSEPSKVTLMWNDRELSQNLSYHSSHCQALTHEYPTLQLPLTRPPCAVTQCIYLFPLFSSHFIFWTYLWRHCVSLKAMCSNLGKIV